MSRHEGVSCDSCLKGNFRGRRYKCLVCYDYDLCGACYDAGSTTTRHTTEHPMQCILTRNDLELYYEGEGLEQQQAFTCPFCGKMGYTESALHEHVTADHTVSTFEVVCPICAAQPGGDPNLITDDFASHLSLEHRSGPRDLISFLDEPSGSRHSVRRIPHPTRGVGSSRNRNRTNMHFSSSGNATSSLSSRDAVDPIAELLSQLSGVRRSAGSGSSTSQLAHIQMQLQLERQQVRAARQQLERLPRRQNQASSSGASHAPASSGNTHGHALGENPASTGQNKQHEFLLSKSLNETLSEEDKAREDQDKLDRLLYVQSVLLGSLKAGISMGENPELSPLLPQLDLLALSPAPRPPPPPASQSDARGITNIAVGGASYTGSPFQLKLDVLSKQAPTPPHNTKPFPSAPEVTPPSPLPLTRTIAIPPPSSSHEKTASSDVIKSSSPREFVGPSRVSKFGPPRDVSKIVGPGSFDRTGSSEDSGGSRDFSKVGPSSELRNVGPSDVPKIGPSEARTCDVSRGGPTSDVSSESPSVNDDVTNSTSPSPSNAKLILAKKLSHNTRPSDIGTIRKLVALRAKAARQSPDPSESLPTPQAANH